MAANGKMSEQSKTLVIAGSRGAGKATTVGNLVYKVCFCIEKLCDVLTIL
jgi:signal recognition particle receptor subunit beta